MYDYDRLRYLNGSQHAITKSESSHFRQYATLCPVSNRPTPKSIMKFTIKSQPLTSSIRNFQISSLKKSLRSVQLLQGNEAKSLFFSRKFHFAFKLIDLTARDDEIEFHILMSFGRPISH